MSAAGQGTHGIVGIQMVADHPIDLPGIQAVHAVHYIHEVPGIGMEEIILQLEAFLKIAKQFETLLQAVVFRFHRYRLNEMMLSFPFHLHRHRLSYPLDICANTVSIRVIEQQVYLCTILSRTYYRSQFPVHSAHNSRWTSCDEKWHSAPFAFLCLSFAIIITQSRKYGDEISKKSLKKQKLFRFFSLPKQEFCARILNRIIVYKNT